jgi:xylulokinase
MSLIAGVDSSTQSTKVEVRDLESGRVVARSSAPHPPTTPPVSEQDPADWWSAFEHAWAGAGAPTVSAISVAGQQHGMVVLDRDRRVVRPAKLWNDTESAADARWLCDQLEGGDAAWAAAVGSVPVASFTITKLSWLHRKEPDAWDRLAHVLLPHDWLTLRLTGELTGELVTDRGDASGTGYWSPATSDYRFDLLGVVDRDRDWTSAVPRVLAPLEAAGKWGDAVVAPGTGDNMAAALGLALALGDTVVSIGTSGTVFGVSDRPSADPSGAVAGFADATGRFLPLVCTLNAAKVLDAVRGLLGVDPVEFDRLAMAGDAGALTLLPYFDGERTPNRPDATGVLGGLRTDVTREQLARAAVDGVVCGLLDGVDALAAHCDVDRIVLAGGGARSAAVRAVFAGLCDRPVSVTTADEAVAAGACVQAAATLTGEPHASIAERWGLGRSEPVEPDVSTDPVMVRARYAALRGDFAPMA